MGSVQMLPPSQTTVVFTHPTVGSQLSLVEGLPSLQDAEISVCEQTPVAELQESVVQALLSSQSASWWQHPATAAFTQPLAGSQESVVQTSPSMQDKEISVCWHPVMESQESSVQKLPSSQDTAVWLQMCWPGLASHVSMVQTLPSSQSAFTSQQPPTWA